MEIISQLHAPTALPQELIKKDAGMIGMEFTPPNLY
jgi:hypothetical protein